MTKEETKLREALEALSVAIRELENTAIGFHLHEDIRNIGISTKILLVKIGE